MMSTPPPVCDAARTIAGVRAALGSDPLRRYAQITASGTIVVSGLSGSVRRDVDLANGRYASREDVAVRGRSVDVYDGKSVWTQDISGGVHPRDAWFPRAQARTAAFIETGAYLQRHAAGDVRCAGVRRRGNRSEIVLRVQPPGGIPAALAIDATTALPVSVAERFPIATVITRFADYRTVDGIALPFSISTGSTLEPADEDHLTVRRYTLRKRVDVRDFTRPSPAPNATMLGGTARTTVPLTLEGRQLLVWASINARPPMPFILDTGGHAIVTAGAAKLLGLRPAGAGESGGAGAGTIALQYARAGSIRLGAAELRDQPLLVIDYPYEFYERGRRQPLAGILGLELFERFATRIDYGRRTLTLWPARSHTYRGNGLRVPIQFQDDMPMIRASADGHEGLFGVDTGNAGPLVLFGDFLRRTGLDRSYAGGTPIIGRGTGGSNAGRLGTLRAFEVGARTVSGVPTDFTNMSRGAFSSWTEAGNAGYEILGRFIPTFDYAHGFLVLDACVRDCVPPRSRAGMQFDKNEPADITVLTVKSAGPASRAGIEPGDRITSIDGEPAADYSRADLAALTSRSGARSIRFTIRRGSTTVKATLRLPAT